MSRALLDSASSDGESGASTEGLGSERRASEDALKINHTYARRFEHNRRRAELQQLEDKYGRATSRRLPGDNHGLGGTHGKEGRTLTETTAEGEADQGPAEDQEEDDEDEEDEVEDEDGNLAPDALDQQFKSTLSAVKRKDPRIYDTSVRFYDQSSLSGARSGQDRSPKQRPVRLKDYHLELLMTNVHGSVQDQGDSFAREQEQLRNDVTKEMHQAVNLSNSSTEPHGADETADGFLVRTNKPTDGTQSQTEQFGLTRQEVQAADENPEGFLSKFLASRAWVPTNSLRPQAFISDDEEDEREAEEFEDCYNLRFEDPDKANRKLVFHSRTAAASGSARQEGNSKRKRARIEEKSQQSAGRMTQDHELARLKELKMDEIAGRLATIQEAGGSQGIAFSTDEWSRFLTADWDDQQWQSFMKEKFGEEYYHTPEPGPSGTTGRTKQAPMRKPKWQYDIDISDLAPAAGQDEGPLPAKQARSHHRLGRHDIERLAEQKARIDRPKASKRSGTFRYRETSPTAFGLTAEDILLASDARLNQYVGLKKLAHFRDKGRKRADKKRLGKKARLREWRRETFGASGPSMGRPAS